MAKHCPVEINFKHNIREWTRELSAFHREQIPFAAALALTETARDDVKPAVELRIELAFDRPTPFTRRGVAYLAARKNNLVATVLIKDRQAAYLKIEETGGVRRPRNRALPIPVAQRRNKYGNLPRGSVRRLLARPDTFSGTVNGHAGIWQRKGRKLRLLVAWEDQATYKPIFRFYETAREAAEIAFPHAFRRALDRAIATAR